ncbi:hypothetical protein JVT61DRAFT_2545 [Boletus reticuloceps]|uniref:Uncharacterized protein n=1 Tax=Boletus reticuloceps TaxID=495285 RepID=A0A8I2YPL0_9AGAM|nr:hypothetical protein JVT61DRAFT_2545 [Boletus reticuloceps]
MPVWRVLKRCLCSVCTEQEGVDADGNPKGVLMEVCLIPSHLKRIQDEQTASHTSPSQVSGSIELPSKDQPSSPTIDSIVGELFALTLTDDCTSPASSYTRTANPLSRNTVTTSDLADSLTRLIIQQSTRSSITPSLPPTDPPSLRSAIPASVIGGCRSCKRDRHRCTIKAHKILSNIEAHIHRANCLLLEPSSLHADQMCQEVLTLRRALEEAHGM